MGKIYEEIDETLRRFIEAQRMFLGVETADRDDSWPPRRGLPPGR